MTRRWFIRCLFMVPILLCITGWGWSEWHMFGLGYTHAGTWTGWRSVWGSVMVGQEPESRMDPDGWHEYVEPGWLISWPPDPPDSILGFKYHYDLEVGWWVQVPYWFLLLLFSGLLFFVWRRTRPRKAGGAFPVEVKGDGVAR